MRKSMTITFKDLSLSPQIQKALEASGYTKPTPVQAAAIPEILKGQDVVASAQTGTGKTAAFVLPALQLMSEVGPQKKPRILILTPTRELAAQVTQAANKYGKFLQFKFVSLVGGAGYPQQIRNLSRPHDIIVATPGRLMDHLENKRVDLSQVEMLILDEADRMLDMGFIDDVKHISKFIPAEHQTLLFSATFDQRIEKVVKQFLKNPARVDFSHEALAPERIQQIVYVADSPAHKMQLLEHLLEQDNIFKAIIFTATKRDADQLADDLKADGLAAAALHGDLKQGARNRTIMQMREGKIQYLVATDVAARGIDISDITHVINFDLPKFSEDYVHRIGRTGRAGKTGVAISLVLPSEARHLHQIEKFTAQKVEQQQIPGLEPKKRLSQSGGKSEAGRSSRGRKRGASYPSERSFGNDSRSFKQDGGRRSESRGNRFAEKDDHQRFSERPKKSGGRQFSDDRQPAYLADPSEKRAKRKFSDDRQPAYLTDPFEKRAKKKFSDDRPSRPGRQEKAGAGKSSHKDQQRSFAGKPAKSTGKKFGNKEGGQSYSARGPKKSSGAKSSAGKSRGSKTSGKRY
jgi:superfamily II DNA/RNA helicase